MEVDITPDSQYAATYSEDGSFRVARNRERRDRPPDEHPGDEEQRLRRFHVLSDGRHVIFTDSHGRPLAYNWQQSRRRQQYSAESVRRQTTHCYAVSPDGKHVAIGEGKGIRILDASTYLSQGKLAPQNLRRAARG